VFFCFCPERLFSKIYMGHSKNYEPYILKYMARNSKYMAYIFNDVSSCVADIWKLTENKPYKAVN
ncbi:MAG: hypothetical protein KIG40_04080, partial [Bacteroidaceae bacterium]|nr:hypothetical protein [Bacteroidaceae bacterium]